MIEFINFLSLYIWGTFTIFVFIGLLAQFYKAPKMFMKTKHHEFVIVSLASKSVGNSLFECIHHTRTKFPDSKVSILIDEGSELEDEIKRYYTSVVVVPREYKRNLLAKGRAINYFVENYVENDTWYSFLDDDNLVQDDKFLYEIQNMDKKGYVATNPILKARPGKSRVAYLMDTIRYFDDVTIFKFFTGFLEKPILGLHGELLTVKGRVLREIGFNRRSLTEDFAFAAEIVRRGYRVWQSETVVSIKSPNTIGDLLKQRGRWFKGVAKDVDRAPFSMQVIVGWRLSVWCLGVFGSWLFSALWFYFDHTYLFLVIGGLYFWVVYAWGVGKARGWLFLPAIPIFGILETVSFAYGLKHKQFIVIDKN